ncbi:hypothetical protein C8F04DRAFT_1270221 [Mycena alexandri]|uniref:F-box domain-containing protein n=1 Tax=Mycena alexandri TaxID=1745969 RepID=A0AAD6SBM0_9AGAR|nr:hypothetical protein C8F04DRAFT_1270221 [Mycena alexandri]
MQSPRIGSFEVSSIPCEVWSRIFSAILLQLKSTSVEFYLACLDLASISSFLRGVVQRNSVFWTGIRLDHTTSEYSIQNIIDRSRGQALDAVLELGACNTLPLERVWEIFGPLLYRCRSFAVRIHDAESLESLACALDHAPLDRLTSLSFSVHSTIANSFPLPGSFDRFGHSLPSLRTLRITRIPFVWITSQSLRGLTSLTIIDLPWSLMWSEWQAIATNASGMKNLCVRNVGCKDFPSDLATMLVFPSLEELDFSFGLTCSSGGLLLRRCSAPLLATLRFHGNEAGHIVALSFTMADLSTIRHLVLSGVSNDAFCYFLFSRLCRLENLEVLQGDSAILDSILAGDVKLGQRSPPEGPVCPQLSSLHVSEASPTDVRNFIVCRGSVVRAIDRVVFGVESTRRFVGSEDLQWLRERAIIEFWYENDNQSS